jgi:hypothetical protein
MLPYTQTHTTYSSAFKYTDVKFTVLKYKNHKENQCLNLSRQVSTSNYISTE